MQRHALAHEDRLLRYEELYEHEALDCMCTLRRDWTEEARLMMYLFIAEDDAPR